jgi:RNA polymerase sigma-70 factor, ECF subfamily
LAVLSGRQAGEGIEPDPAGWVLTDMLAIRTTAAARKGRASGDNNNAINSMTAARQESPAAEGTTAAARDERELALLARIAARDSVAMKELYFLYHRRLARFLTRLTARTDLAEEVINDTFWAVWQRAGDFRGASLVSTWIFGIAYRRALKTLQRLRPPPSMEKDDSTECLVDAPWERAELNEWLAVALARLPPEQRAVIELAYNLGHSCEEIARIMECPVNTIKTRMFYARRKLRVLLLALAGPA